jgi:hypothetical protein
MYYQRAYTEPVTLPGSGALLYPCYASRGQDAQQNPAGALCGAFHRSDDMARTGAYGQSSSALTVRILMSHRLQCCRTVDCSLSPDLTL